MPIDSSQPMLDLNEAGTASGRAGGRRRTITAKRLLCAARYGELGASSRLRLMQYMPWLNRAGIHTTMRAFLSNHYVTALYADTSRAGAVAAAYLRALGAARASRRHDLLWIEKEYLPWLPYWLERLAIGRTRYVLDFDDAWALRYETSRFWLVRRIFGNKFRRLVQGAALTITANQTLHEWAVAQGASRVLLLPTVIDLDSYPVTAPPDGPFTLCWIGTPLTALYLNEIAGALQQLSAEAPFELMIIGAPDFSIPGVTCRHEAWSEASEAGLVAACHGGIMPLPDDAWARGKSGYKLIQYMAAARPTIASPVGANNDIVTSGETGYLAGDNASWLQAMRQLRDDPALRARMGAAARQRVETKYALQVTAPLLIRQFQDLFERA